MAESVKQKRRTNRQKLYDLFVDRRWHSLSAIQKVGGYRYGARIWELRRMGFVIERRERSPDVFEYRLTRMAAQLAFGFEDDPPRPQDPGPDPNQQSIPFEEVKGGEVQGDSEPV